MIKSFTAISRFIFTLLLCFLAFNANAKNVINIVKWQENSHLLARGKSSEILIVGQIDKSFKHRTMSSFSISFDPNKRIDINSVRCDYKKARYVFKKNLLTIYFPKKKTAGNKFVVYYSYRETYPKVNEFLRSEIIEIPSFAAGAQSQVVVNFPRYMNSVTLNPNIKQSLGSFVYKSRVPRRGVHEIVKLASTRTDWDVTIKVGINSNKSLRKVDVVIPHYFDSNTQKVSRFKVDANIKPSKETKKDNKHVFQFKTDSKWLIIKNNALISAGKENHTKINRNPNDYKDVTQEERRNLKSILGHIKKSNNLVYRNLPLYAKIGKFVNKYITYDKAYLGSLPNLENIIKNKVGVCTEYARLFDALARLAGIPSLVIEGAACGEYEECQAHAWNLIYYNGKWIEVDPTWDLMSGAVSSSHIYFNDRNEGKIEVQYSKARSGNVRSTMDFDMKMVR